MTEQPPVRRRPTRVGRRTTLSTLAVVAVLLIPIRLWVAEPLRIVTASMEPTLTPGEHVLAWKLPALEPPLHRGDLVAFEHGPGPLYVKRVVGVGGDRVALRDGRLFVNGRAVREEYAAPDRIDSVYFGPVVVPDGKVFVMGDNRANSWDSRAFGPVARDDLRGRVVAVLWPPSKLGGTP